MVTRSDAGGFELETPLEQLKGFGPKRGAVLAGAGVRTVRDLLFHLPRRYRRRLAPIPIAEVEAGTDAAIVADVTSRRSSRRGRRSLTRIGVQDRSGRIDVLFFNQPHMARSLARGERCFFQGRVGERNGSLHLVASFHEKDREDQDTSQGGAAAGIPVYELPEGIPPRLFRRTISQLLGNLAGRLPDWRDRYGYDDGDLLELGETVQQMHFPGEAAHFERARRRLAYEEFVRIRLPLERLRARIAKSAKAHACAVSDEQRQLLVAALPFTLTAAQQRVVTVVLDELGRSTPMHRLLHGDVGSGKTAVALLALAAVVRSGWQAALLAPTEVLARQHEATASQLLEPLGIEVLRLSRGSVARERAAIRERLDSGEPLLLVGTHALLNASLRIPRLALAVVDEQHRFGVAQRARLRAKGVSVDLLVMTATPIPRSLAMTLYGDLDLSVLDEMPPGRTPVETRLVERSGLAAVLEEVRSEARDGGRVYVVCPVVKGSEDSDRAAAIDSARSLHRQFQGDPVVALAHGRRTPEQNRQALEEFRAGRAPVLVATVVIEVGVDVPEATMMVVLDADRFGLAALHQLRGRVGRGQRSSRCILVADPARSQTRERLLVLVEESSGFRIAERDLELRGAGQLFGKRQHGALDLSFGDPVRDVDLLERARDDARRLLDERLDQTIEGWLPTLPGLGRREENDPGPG